MSIEKHGSSLVDLIALAQKFEPDAAQDPQLVTNTVQSTDIGLSLAGRAGKPEKNAPEAQTMVVPKENANRLVAKW